MKRNAGDGVSPAFQKGKQNEEVKEESQSTHRRDTKFQIELRMQFNLNMIQCFFILFTLNQGDIFAMMIGP
jgi:hypothetical protein